MPLLEVLPTLKQLTRKEKFKAVQFLVADLENEDSSPLSLISSSGVYEVWSPIEGSEVLVLSMEECLRKHRDVKEAL
ncbi:hypothetical protein [Armatimonas sp.]|uniref:hypothetical protein n=1 Tax=Armatimonas sp. TaxID=1872638 RepID=UPI0037538962